MPTAGSSLLAGAGRARIAAPSFPVDGFVAENDPLFVRVVLLDHAGERLAIAVLDQTSIAAASLAGVTSALAGVLEIAPARLLVCASHTFSAPHVDGPGPRQDALESAAVEAAAGAVRGLQPARLGWATGFADVNVNRDLSTPDGWWLGANDAGESDKELGVLRIDGAAGRPIAVLMNYAVQPSILNAVHDPLWASGDGRGAAIPRTGPGAAPPGTASGLVSADLAGSAVRHVEEALGGVAMFLAGAAGDQAPLLTTSRPAAAVVLMEMLGARLGAAAVAVARRVECVDGAPVLRLEEDSVQVAGQPMPRREALRPRRTYEFGDTGSVIAPLWAGRIGGLAIAAVQAELTSVTGRWIKQGSPFAATFVVTMANGAAKYMADADSYARITYAAMNSPYAAGAAEVVAARLVSRLSALCRSSRSG